MQTINTSRRDFLKAGTIAALVRAGGLPLLSATAKGKPSIDEKTGPYALKPIRDYLKRFSPVKTLLKKNGDYRLVYDILHWSWVNGGRGTYANSIVGRVAIERKEAGEAAVYKINQRTLIGGMDNFLEARIVCESNGLNSLREWTLSSFSRVVNGGPVPLSRLNEHGRYDKGRIGIESGDHNYGFAAKNPLVSQWTLLDFLIRKAQPTSDAKFDLLQDLSLFKPSQSLMYDSVTPVELKDGRTIELQTYAQTGQGILPIHYLLDEQGRPQLVTKSILSWALSQAD